MLPKAHMGELMNPVEIEEAVSQLASEPFDRAEFAYQFLTAFGNPRTLAFSSPVICRDALTLRQQ